MLIPRVESLTYRRKIPIARTSCCTHHLVSYFTCIQNGTQPETSVLTTIRAERGGALTVEPPKRAPVLERIIFIAILLLIL